MTGTDDYGGYSYLADPTAISSWSIPFDGALNSDGSTLFMFSNGGCSEYIITKNNQFNTEYNGANRFIVASHIDVDYYARWYNRATFAEDPWISWLDHSSENYYSLLYGENSWSATATERFSLNDDKSVNVYISLVQYSPFFLCIYTE